MTSQSRGVRKKKLGPPFNLGVRKIDDVFRETNSPSNVIAWASVAVKKHTVRLESVHTPIVVILPLEGV